MVARWHPAHLLLDVDDGDHAPTASDLRTGLSVTDDRDGEPCRCADCTARWAGPGAYPDDEESAIG